jgi:hypothetical protein
MALEDTRDLLKFLQPFSEENKKLALWLREFVWKLYPRCNELIYDNYNALAFGWSASDRLGDTFCSIAVFGKEYLHFGFYRGSALSDPEKRLLGKGTQYRYIKVFRKEDFPKLYIKKLLKEAHSHSLAGLKEGKQVIKGHTITKSVATKKRRPG